MYGMGPDTQAMKDKSRATWQSEASSDGLFDDEEDDGDAHTSMEEMLQRAEGKTAVLRLELAAATDRATTAEDALRVKEEECTELHALVDRLQAELAAACESGRALLLLLLLWLMRQRLQLHRRGLYAWMQKCRQRCACPHHA